MTRLLAVELRTERDVVLARQRTRQVAALLGFDPLDQARLASAVSEVARHALQRGGGSAEFFADGRVFRAAVRDRGPGVADADSLFDSAAGAGLANARRLLDEFAVDSAPGAGTVVRVAKELPRGAPAPDLPRVRAELGKPAPDDPMVEVQRQNQELLRLLGELRDRESRLAELNRELEETNRGVVALYAELEEKADSLKRASELKSRFLSNMSHEFRTPLNSVLGLTQLLLDRADGPLTDEQERQVNYVRRAAQGLVELVNDLLDLAKVEAGKVVVRPDEFRAADLFAALRGMLRPLASNDAVSLVFEDAGPAGVLRTDEAKVSQILRNFISNALKFTPAGEVRVRAADGPDETVVFRVADTGIGIAPADQERIFEEFGQVESAVQARVKGTGLGLPLSRRLAELLGGSVAVESAPGAGSTFTLTVPRVYGASAPPAVLIVDDDEIARYLLRGHLAAARFEVLEAPGGEEGLRRARADRPRAVFLDLSMPGLSGYDVLDRLKADPETRDIPVILYTSQVLDDAARARLGGGLAGVLPKSAAGSPGAARQVLEVLASAGVPPPAQRNGDA